VIAGIYYRRIHMASWTTQELSAPPKDASTPGDYVVTKEFLNRDPRHIVVEVTGLSANTKVALEDSADGIVFERVHQSSSLTKVGDRVVWRYSADIHNGYVIRNICRIVLDTNSYDKVYVTWSP
jgi:hypothetical protein